MSAVFLCKTRVYRKMNGMPQISACSVFRALAIVVLLRRENYETALKIFLGTCCSGCECWRVFLRLSSSVYTRYNWVFFSVSIPC